MDNEKTTPPPPPPPPDQRVPTTASEYDSVTASGTPIRMEITAQQGDPHKR